MSRQSRRPQRISAAKAIQMIPADSDSDDEMYQCDDSNSDTDYVEEDTDKELDIIADDEGSASDARLWLLHLLKIVRCCLKTRR